MHRYEEGTSGASSPPRRIPVGFKQADLMRMHALSPRNIATRPVAREDAALENHHPQNVSPVRRRRGGSVDNGRDNFERQPRDVSRRSILTVTMNFGKSIGMSTDDDLMVKRVVPRGQAEAKGVTSGMRVVAVGGFIVTTGEQLRDAVREYRRMNMSRSNMECSVIFLKEN